MFVREEKIITELLDDIISAILQPLNVPYLVSTACTKLEGLRILPPSIGRM
jgi:hypothetical protein